MRVLIACEFSGHVRDSFLLFGHDAWSCDLDPSDGYNHLQCDVLEVLNGGWDLMIAHPPCTYLATVSNKWRRHGPLEDRIERMHKRHDALDFVVTLMNAPIERIAIENPISVISSQIRKPDQIIHPWQFGHNEEKTTWLWLKNLPPLEPTHVVEGRETRLQDLPPTPDRGKLRSVTYPGIAEAMATQWGSLPC